MRHSLICLLIFPLLLCSSLAMSQSANKQAQRTQPKYSEVRIFATNAADFKRIQEAGLFIDHANTKLGHYSDAWLSETEIDLLKKSGVRYDILVDDWDVYYNNLPKMTETEKEQAVQESAQQYNVSHSIYGSMGGYLTYTEVVGKLDSMRMEYPQLISAKFPIGTTIEGRTQWAVRVTKNPDAPTGRPEAMYHALIHAREPESMETQMYYFYWLFENYGTDPLATYILENREIYWIPVFNPDGYVYNQTTNPNGGGMWRANRRIISGSCGPVDLNRNFGTYQFWNSPNGGSSTDSCSGGSGTYRGRTPFSEPETQAIMNFVNSRNFNVSFGAHTYGNYLIKPWAWQDPTPTPDDAKYIQFLAEMKASNPVYTTGTPSQTVGYMVRGGSDDWYYNDSAHVGHHITAITPETGSSFWPAQNQIIPLAQGMLFNNQYMSLIAGPYVNPVSRTFSQQTYTPGQTGTYKVVIKNKGLLDASNVIVSWTSASSHITVPTTQFEYPSLGSFAVDSCVFDFTISPSVSNNSAIPTQVTIKIGAATVLSAQVYVYVGTGMALLNDNGSTFTNWTTTGTWAVTTAQFNSAPSSFTDSPVGNYTNNSNNSMTLAASIAADSTPVLNLGFYHRYATQANFDSCNVEVSANNGTTWQPVASYSGTLSTWTQQALDISSHVNGSNQVKIRFRLASNASVTADGWYVDDVRLNGYRVATDTGLVVAPAQLSFSGLAGTAFQDNLTLKNFTSSALQVSIAESLTTTFLLPSLSPRLTRQHDLRSIISRLRIAFQRAGITAANFPRPVDGVGDDPQVYNTIITDERGEGILGAADVHRVQHQLRTFLGVTYHDFRIALAVPSDSNIAGFISLDTDQDFGTGAFPTPFGVGPVARDIGSEREVFFDASGVIIDSLIGLGRIPAGVVLSTETDTIVGTPFLLSITKDSVFTVTTTNILQQGIRADWLSDPDGNMNVTAVAASYTQGENPAPDYAPIIGHGLVGAETGVSWLSESPAALSIPAGDSALVNVTALAARTTGTYSAFLQVKSVGRSTINIPTTLTVTGIPQAHIVLSAPGLTASVPLGDSTLFDLTVSNTGNGDLVWGILDTNNTAWAAASPAFGSITPSSSAIVTIILRTAGLTPGNTYTSQILMISNDPVNNGIVFPLSLTVLPSLDVGGEKGTVPTAFALYQNYPNPFNPETRIAFDLPKSSFISLKVFNVIGQEVATLVNENLPAGRFTVTFGRERYLESGIYFYRIIAGDFVQTRKLVLIK